MHHTQEAFAAARAMVCVMTPELLRDYEQFLRDEESSESTIQKYRRALNRLYGAAGEKPLTKDWLLQWKAELLKTYQAGTVNGILSAANGFFRFCGWDHLHIRQVKTQRTTYREPERNLEKAEYRKLVETARRLGWLRLALLMEVLASTGIRISELAYITVESLLTGSATVDCKGKQRRIIIPKKLCKALAAYCKTAGITSGPVFVTRGGKPMNRSNIWRELKAAAKAAGVPASKVFPHNFRHLFAVVYYNHHKDIAKLADLLGHASINTTRIYIMEDGTEHRRQIDRLGLVL